MPDSSTSIMSTTNDLLLMTHRPRKATTNNETEQMGSFLLRLPGEIRTQIYYLLLTSEQLPAIRRLVSMNHCSSYVLPSLPLHSGLLSTCKQIYAEASPILYACNTFTASPTLLTQMFYMINPSRPICSPVTAKKIRRWYINIRIDCDARFTEEQVTEAFTGVEELEVEATQAMFRAASSHVLMLFGGVRGVESAKVVGSIEDDFAQWLTHSMMSPLGADVEPFDDGEEKRKVGSLSQLYDVWLHGNR